MKDLWPVAGMVLLTAPVAALFLFGPRHEKGCLPAENDRVPAIYPGDELQREEMRK